MSETITARKAILKDKDGNYIIPVTPDIVNEGLEYLVGVRSNIQEQLDSKVDVDYPVYEFVISNTDLNPATRVSYPTGCYNENFTPMGMDYTNGVFNYGSWKNNWILNRLKPCMVYNQNELDGNNESRLGQIMEFLNPDNYAQTVEGGASHIADTTCNANGMLQAGQVWVKAENEDNDSAVHIWLAAKKVSEDFHCYTHIDANNELNEYYYHSLYDAGVVNNTLRSLSGLMPYAGSGVTGTVQINAAKANGNGHDIGEKAFKNLLTLLAILWGKSTDCQAVFGKGNISSYVSDSNTGVLAAGTLDDKGMFYGYNTDKSAVKFAGIENPWGNVFNREEGMICVNGLIKIKLTPNTADGSSASSYNTDGSGYIDTGINFGNFTNGSGSYISTVKAVNGCLLPTNNTGSASTGMCDVNWFNTSQASGFALSGGSSDSGLGCGLFYVTLTDPVSDNWWGSGCSLSYRPL